MRICYRSLLDFASFCCPSLLFGLCARCFYCHNISLPTCSSRLLLFCGFWGWYVFDFMIFFAAHYCFLILGALSRVYRSFALFSACWLPINAFSRLPSPDVAGLFRCFSTVFSTFHVKHCCFLYDLLLFHRLFFTVSKAIFCGFCCLVFLIFACCHTVLCGLHADCLLLAFVGGRCRGIIFLLSCLALLCATPHFLIRAAFVPCFRVENVFVRVSES